MVYKITKLINGKSRGATDIPIVDKQGKLLTTKAEQEARWAERFSEVLNRPLPPVETEVQEPDDCEEDDEGRQASPEEATNRGEQGLVYKITKLISSKSRGATDTPIVDKQG